MKRSRINKSKETTEKSLEVEATTTKTSMASQGQIMLTEEHDASTNTNSGAAPARDTENTTNPSTADLMKAIGTLQNSVDTKFTTISTALETMKNTMATTTKKVREMEGEVNIHVGRLYVSKSFAKVSRKRVMNSSKNWMTAIKTAEHSDHRDRGGNRERKSNAIYHRTDSIPARGQGWTGHLAYRA